MSRQLVRTRREPEGACLSCDASIDPQIARVVGDENGNVPVCKRCATNRDGHSVQNTVRAVRRYLGEHSTDVTGAGGQR